MKLVKATAFLNPLAVKLFVVQAYETSITGKLCTVVRCLNNEAVTYITELGAKPFFFGWKNGDCASAKTSKCRNAPESLYTVTSNVSVFILNECD